MKCDLCGLVPLRIIKDEWQSLSPLLIKQLKKDGWIITDNEILCPRCAKGTDNEPKKRILRVVENER